MPKSIDELLEGVSHEVRRRPAYSEYRLQPAPRADYFFSIWLYGDGEAHVVARRVNGMPDEPFWHYVLEPHDFRDADELGQTLVDEVERIVRNPTRIVQRRGLIFWSFHCELFENGEWRRLSSFAIPRWSRGVPGISGNERIYSSAPPPSARAESAPL